MGLESVDKLYQRICDKKINLNYSILFLTANSRMFVFDILYTNSWVWVIHTVWKVSKYGVISGPYFPTFGLNTERYKYLSVWSPNAGKYRPEITPNLGTFHAVTQHCFQWVIQHYKLNWHFHQFHATENVCSQLTIDTTLN